MNDVSEVLTQLKQLSDRMERIEGALMGDGELGIHGLVGRLVEAETRSLRLEKRIDRMLWTAAGVGASGAGIVEIIQRMLAP